MVEKTIISVCVCVCVCVSSMRKMPQCTNQFEQRVDCEMIQQIDGNIKSHRFSLADLFALNSQTLYYIHRQSTILLVSLLYSLSLHRFVIFAHNRHRQQFKMCVYHYYSFVVGFFLSFFICLSIIGIITLCIAHSASSQLESNIEEKEIAFRIR